MNTAQVPAPVPATTTAEKILDAAEDLFAERGFTATSLGDVAERVGIRSPSLYNHFRNKEALYQAVLQRLMAAFSEPLQTLTSLPVTRERLELWLREVVQLHHRRPNLARLLQHAALSGGPEVRGMVRDLFSPLFEPATEAGIPVPALANSELQPWGVIALNNMVMSYITMAPLYGDLLGQDPLGSDAQDKQLRLLLMVLRATLDYQPDAGHPAG